MSISINYPPFHINDIPPSLQLLAVQSTKALAYLLIPSELLYFSIYFLHKRQHKVYEILTILALVAFWAAPVVAPVRCGAARCLENFAIAIGTMKILDIWARRHNLPKYTSGKMPPDWLFALIVLTELRYESFAPNHIRHPQYQENFSEPMQLGIHIGIFCVFQCLPQGWPTILALEVLLAIYILWTSLQLVLRYKSSPALFGPLYMADSIGGFWSETWHNAFTAPCTSLAYEPLRRGLPTLGVPVSIARVVGVIGAFGLMAAFHMYALAPILKMDALIRVGVFFVGNGIATVLEAAVWGKKKHVLKVLIAWAFELAISTWTAAGMEIPNGLSKIPWREICEA